MQPGLIFKMKNMNFGKEKDEKSLYNMTDLFNKLINSFGNELTGQGKAHKVISRTIEDGDNFIDARFLVDERGQVVTMEATGRLRKSEKEEQLEQLNDQLSEITKEMNLNVRNQEFIAAQNCLDKINQIKKDIQSLVKEDLMPLHKQS